MPPTGAETGARNADLILDFGNWARRDGRGTVFDFSPVPAAERRHALAGRRLGLRERLATLPAEQKRKFLPLVPDLVIELASPTDDDRALHAKLREWRDNGRLAWLILPDRRQVWRYALGEEPTCLQDPQYLGDEALLPGLLLPLARIWEPEPVARRCRGGGARDGGRNNSAGRSPWSPQAPGLVRVPCADQAPSGQHRPGSAPCAAATPAPVEPAGDDEACAVLRPRWAHRRLRARLPRGGLVTPGDDETITRSTRVLQPVSPSGMARRRRNRAAAARGARDEKRGPSWREDGIISRKANRAKSPSASTYQRRRLPPQACQILDLQGHAGVLRQAWLMAHQKVPVQGGVGTGALALALARIVAASGAVVAEHPGDELVRRRWAHGKQTLYRQRQDIERMSDHCAGCRYDPGQRDRGRACPYTTLYWDFMMRHQPHLAKNPRIALQVKNLGTPEEEKGPGSLNSPNSERQLTLFAFRE